MALLFQYCRLVLSKYVHLARRFLTHKPRSAAVCYSRSLRGYVTTFTTSREFQQQINVSQSAAPYDPSGPISDPSLKCTDDVLGSAEMRHEVHERLLLRF